jgi:ubiquitin-activating enzyme E1
LIGFDIKRGRPILFIIITKNHTKNNTMVEEVKLDTNLYSRQIGTFGLETMGKLIKMNVLIVGMRGLGVETAKNLCLAGPKSVTIYDPTVVSIADRGSNFYIKQEHVGTTTRAEASVTQLRELNPYV